MSASAILAVETATERVGVALRLPDGSVRVREETGLKAPSRFIYEWIRGLLADAGLGPGDLAAVAYGAGPGSFTGVRVAADVAQAIGFVRGCPVVPVSTLAAMAHAALATGEAGIALAALDARMGEIYAGIYARGAEGPVTLMPESLASPAAPFTLPDRPFVAVGPGVGVFPELLADAGTRLVAVRPEVLPEVRSVLALGELGLAAGAQTTALDALPNYVRERVTR